MNFTEQEKAILAIVQDNLPDSLNPYEDIARRCGVSEEDVLSLLQRLRESGVIRRFGASIRHHRSPWRANAMVAWIASEEQALDFAQVATDLPNISHVYFRPSSAPDWPYTLYTMIHGRTQAECDETVNRLLASWPLQEYAVLRTVRELKKISPTYFPR